MPDDLPAPTPLEAALTQLQGRVHGPFTPLDDGTGRIDCMVDHPRFGMIPYTAWADDAEAFGQAVWQLASTA